MTALLHVTWGLALLCSLPSSVGSMLLLPRDSGWWNLVHYGSAGRGPSFPLYTVLLFFPFPLTAATTQWWIWQTEGQRNILKSYLQHWLWVRLSVALLWITCVHFQEICWTKHILCRLYKSIEKIINICVAVTHWATSYTIFASGFGEKK